MVSEPFDASAVPQVGRGNSQATTNEFYDRQAKTINAAAVLLRTVRNDIVLVKPSYRDVWQLPGGLLDAGESPRAAAQRETQEELGLSLPIGRLLCVDYKPARSERPACHQFVFDGGSLSDGQLAAIKIAENEIEDWQTVSQIDAPTFVQQGGPSSRLVECLKALRNGSTVYLEDGHPVS